jgi:hypothetical protein
LRRRMRPGVAHGMPPCFHRCAQALAWAGHEEGETGQVRHADTDSADGEVMRNRG